MTDAARPLTTHEGSVLLNIARSAIENELGVRNGMPAHDEPVLRQVGASFVTLTESGKLRGCIGTVEAYRRIGEDVAENALAAAFSDPRFAPISADELDDLKIEVSRLSAIEPIETHGSEAAAIAALRPGVDGLVLRWGRHRATFLPQVWDELPEPEQFLRRLKRKAHLDESFWDPSIELGRYEVQSWREK